MVFWVERQQLYGGTARRWGWQGGRIFAIADVFDALTSHRPNKEAQSFDASMEIIGRDRGTHFDPQLLDVFARIARPLHEALTTRDEAYSHQELQLMVTRHFRQDIETLLARDMA